LAAEDIVREHIKAFNDHNADAWAGHYTPDAVISDPQYPEPVRGRDGIRKDIADFFAAFPDIKFNLTNVVASGDSIALEGSGVGTHTGSMEGPGGEIPPTNKRVEVAYAAFVKTNAQGQITEERRYYDMAGMMMQLGLMPEG
jgi:steroid delta-isomerase-like uncharacterized protein